MHVRTESSCVCKSAEGICPLRLSCHTCPGDLKSMHMHACACHRTCPGAGHCTAQPGPTTAAARRDVEPHPGHQSHFMACLLVAALTACMLGTASATTHSAWSPVLQAPLTISSGVQGLQLVCELYRRSTAISSYVCRKHTLCMRRTS